MNRFSTAKLANRTAIIYGAIFTLFVFFLLVPWCPHPMKEPIDISWDLGLHYGFAHNEHFGTDLVFNFGPWGFVYAREYYPLTYRYTLIFWCGMSLIYAATLWRMSGEVTRKAAAQPAIAASLIMLAAYFSDVTFFCLNVLLVSFYFLLPELDSRRERPQVLSLAIAAGITGMVKFTFFISGMWSVLLISMDQVVRRRKLPSVLIAFAISLIASWCSSNQPAGNLIKYFTSSLQITREYSEAMALVGGQDWRCLPIIAAIAAYLAVIGVSGYRRGKLYVVHACLAFAGLFFLLFKQSFVRHDLVAGHGPIAALSLSFLGVILTCLYFKRNERATIKSAVAIVTAGTIAVTLPLAYGSTPFVGTVLMGVGEIAHAFQNGATFISTLRGQNEQGAAYQKQMESVRSNAPLPMVSGSIDIYPIDITRVIAHDLKLNNRPIIQSYQAYDSALLEWNANHLYGDKAPDWVVFCVLSSIDKRMPAFEDSTSWLALIRKYDLDRPVSGGTLLKKRTGADRRCTVNKFATLQGKLGEKLNLPDFRDTHVWAEITLHPTVLDKLISLFYKVSPPQLCLDLTDGTSRAYTAPSHILSTGFLLSPLVETDDEFRALFTPVAANAQPENCIKSLTLKSTFAMPVFAKDFEVTLYKLDL